LLNQEMVGAFLSGPFLTRVLASARGHRCALSALVEEKVILIVQEVRPQLGEYQTTRSDKISH